MYLKKITIKNFRSLVDVEVSIGSYTALVGLNDSGKSNLLRALNLFFNSQTDLGHQLNFEKDFSQQAKIAVKKARQIEIILEFSPPKHYTDKNELVWKKVYRSDSPEPFADEVTRKDGQLFSKGAKSEYWVRHISFEYVPAIRGRAFFFILKRRLYNTLAATVAPKLTKASDTFLSDLRKEVKKIESESQRLLSLKTEFSLPADLGELFEVLDFDSSDEHANTSLLYRGDGIQGRHIPLILKFLADQRKAASASGKPPSETIWGFEEPENNLELIKQIETADEFGEYSKTIQIIVSTHSPAFYGKVKNNGGVKNVLRDQGRTTFSDSITPQAIDLQLGLMPFIEPYLAKAIEDRNAVMQQFEASKLDVMIVDKPILYVEGDTDKIILDVVFSSLKSHNKNFEIVAKKGLGGGVNWVVGCCIARAAMTDSKELAGALFDDDDAGREGVNKVSAATTAINRAGRVKCFTVGKKNGADHIRTFRKIGFSLPIAIEELCSADSWLHAKEKNWLVERENMIIANAHLVTKSETYLAFLDRIIPDTHMRLVADYKIDVHKKGNFAKYVASAITAGHAIPLTLTVLANEILEYYSQ